MPTFFVEGCTGDLLAFILAESLSNSKAAGKSAPILTKWKPLRRQACPRVAVLELETIGMEHGPRNSIKRLEDLFQRSARRQSAQSRTAHQAPAQTIRN